MPSTRYSDADPYPPIRGARDASKDCFGFLPYRRRIQKTKNVVLHFNATTNRLEIFEWYMSSSKHFPWVLSRQRCSLT